MNISVISGRLTKDPETRYLPNGSAVSSFTLAVDRRFKKEDEPNADFIRCKAFGKTAEFVEKHFVKGKGMMLNGRISTGSYKDSEGRTVYTTEVIADNVEFMGSKSEEQKQAPPKAPDDGFIAIPDNVDDEFLPFA